MSAKIIFDSDAAMRRIELDKATKIIEIRTKLDDIFHNKIKTPEQVYFVHDLLKQYLMLSGEEYKITFKENTIV